MKSLDGSPFSDGKSAVTWIPLSTCSATVTVTSTTDLSSPLVPVILIG